MTGIRQEPSGEYVVSIREIDRWGKELSREEIGCEQLYLAAGVLGTTELLLRARETGELANLQRRGRQRLRQQRRHDGRRTTRADRIRSGTQQSLMGMINLDGRDDPDNPVYASMFSLPLPVETTRWATT